jgi:hypothetical protein
MFLEDRADASNPGEASMSPNWDTWKPSLRLPSDFGHVGKKLIGGTYLTEG